MMTKRFPLLLVFLLLPVFFCGCSNREQQEIETLKKEVLSIHDEAMAKMGTLHELEMKIKKLAAEDDATAAEQRIYEQSIEKLRQAHTSMMQWMREYQEPADDTPYAEQHAYLTTRKKEILKVQQLTDEAIQHGNSLTGGGQ